MQFKPLLFFIIISFLSFVSFHYNHYKPLSSEPETSKFDSIKENSLTILKEKTVKISKHKHAHEIEGIFKKRRNGIIDKIEKEHFLFDEKINPFFDNILDEIIQKNEVLQSDHINLLVSRYPWPNASCIGDGTLIVNIGLVSKLETEDQIAFVICHELAHWYLNHVDNDIIKTVQTIHSREFKRELKSISKRKYNRLNRYKNLMKGIVYDDRKHSRLNESEADSLGFVFYSNTQYLITEAVSALEILNTIDQEKYKEPLQLGKILGPENYPFKEEWIKERSTLFGGAKIQQESKWDIDSLKTHPDCKKRVAAISEMITKIDTHKKLQNIEDIREICDFEILIYEYEIGLLKSSLFHTLQLIPLHENNIFLETMMLKCMVDIHEKQVNHQNISDQKIEDLEYKKLNRLFDNISFSELAELNFHLSQEGLKKGYSNESEYVFLAAKAAHYAKKTDVFNQLLEAYKKDFPEDSFIEELNSLSH